MILQDQLAGACTVLLGFRGSDHAAGAGLLTGAQVATDDGSAGHHGTVTEMLERELAGDRKAEVYACGPAGMLESVRALCERSGTPVQLALEAPMACGFGACYGCVVPRRGGGYLRVCVEGPVISGSELAAVDEHAGAPA
jgi:NAD(P)H-flavin reductase